MKVLAMKAMPTTPTMAATMMTPIRVPFWRVSARAACCSLTALLAR
jgi:hypothetical protein